MFNYKKLIIGGSILIAGSLLLYLEEYRGNKAIVIGSYIIIGNGLYFIFEEMCNHFYKKAAGWNNKRIGSKIKYVLFVGTLCLIIQFIYDLSSRRIDNILQTRATKIAIASVVDTRIENNRAGSSYYAIMEFSTGTETVEKAILYEGHKYLMGQKYEVKYSVEYPQMFRIIRRTL